MKRFGFLFLGTLLFLAGALRDAGDQWIADTDLPLILTETSTEVRDRNGALLRAYPVGTGIWRLAPGRVDPGFTAMLIRYEDKRFYSHSGVDGWAMLRAVRQAIWNGRPVSGGSTLTMQVARLLEDGTTGRWAGKLRQMRVAWALERRLSKDDILRLYLTHAPYGGNLEGVRAATLAWFGKEPHRLTPAQSALLVALPQRPEGRRPDRYPDQARAARDRVLYRMQKQTVLDGAEARAALSDPIPTAQRPFPQLAPHLADRARLEAPEQATHALTLDADLQHKVEGLVARAATAAGPQVSGALIVADHQTGEILASVGSPAYHAARQGFVDMTQAVRSPGSTLKPLIYGLGFDQGMIHPETLIHDGPVMFGRYAPRNFDGEFRGDVRVRDALQMSLNIPVVRLTNELGAARLVASLKQGGAAPKLPNGMPGLAIALGGVGVNLQDLVQLYAGLANAGQGVKLHHRSEQSGAPVGRMISDVAAWHVGDILRGLAPPPGAQAHVVAYKTGTSYGHRDAWAIGYDGRHVIGVWLGRADGTPVPGAFGGDLAAPVLFEAFGRLKPDFDPLPAPPAATLILGAAELPLPLRRFRPRSAVFEIAQDAPQLLFPPDGARLALGTDPVTLKVRGGVAPFMVLTDGAAVATGLYQREFEVPNPGAGFSTFVVVDTAGRSDRVAVRLED